MIMTQRYYSQGKFSLNIRNSSNYHVLMRNADENTNLRVAHTMKLKPEIEKANELNENKMYPYIFIDCNNFSRLSGIKVFIDIFGKVKKVIMKNDAYALILLREFDSEFTKLGGNLAIRNETSNKQRNRDDCLEAKTPEEKSGESRETNSDSTANGSTNSSAARSASRTARNQKRDQFERSIRKIIHRYKKRPFL